MSTKPQDFFTPDELPASITVYVLKRRITQHNITGILERSIVEFAGQVFIREERAKQEVEVLHKIVADTQKGYTDFGLPILQDVEYFYEDYTAT